MDQNIKRKLRRHESEEDDSVQGKHVIQLPNDLTFAVLEVRKSMEMLLKKHLGASQDTFVRGINSQESFAISVGAN